MSAELTAALLVGAAVTNGLLAGLFFAFTCAVSPALRRVSDRTYVDTFRAINSAILNVVFLAVFFAAPLAAAAGAIGQREIPAVAGALCSVATFAITAARNVPLNQGLDAAPLSDDSDYRLARKRFEAAWNRWNQARTLTSVAALALLAVAIAG